MTYEELLPLLVASEGAEDETERELLAELLEKALKYVQFRVRWSVMSMDERAAHDAYRTSAHNAFIDSVRIYLRYLKRSKEDIDDSLPDDRKLIGDWACKLAADFGVRNR